MTGQCEICGKYVPLEKHHVFGGRGRRQISDKYGAVAHLCRECHNEPPNGVHYNKAVRLWLQEKTQRELMKKYNWSVQDFINRFGKNYL